MQTTTASRIAFYFSFLLLVILSAAGCQPKDIDITIPKQPKRMAVASANISNTAFFIALSYSFYSLDNTDTASATDEDGTPLLIDSALVTPTASNGQPDTLAFLSPGIFGSTSLLLQAGATYTLQCKDLRNSNVANATTTYYPAVLVDTAQPFIICHTSDTTVKLNLQFKKAAGAEMHYYMLSYSNINPNNTPGPVNGESFKFFNDENIKKVELFTDADAVADVIKVTPSLRVYPTDTLYAQVGQIDQGYYNYLTAYKRTGSLFNQLTGEPISLPTNIITGYGYFSLYTPQRYVFDLNDY